jgi:hypothetical protein
MEDLIMKQDLVKLSLDLYRNDVQNYSKGKANEVIRSAFVDIIGSDTPSYKEFRRHKTEIFEIIEEVLEQTVVDGLVQSSFFDQFVDYRDEKLGDTKEFYVEDRSMLVVSRHAGNHWDIRRQKLNIGDTFTVQTESLAVAIYTDFKRFLAGRLDWDALIRKVGEGFLNEVNSRIYTSFMNTISTLPTEFKATGTFDEAKLLEIAEHVQASNGYAPLVIAGTRKALSKLTGKETLASEKMKDQLNQKGVLEYWNGYSLLTIPQSHKANTFDFMIDNDRLMILPANIKPIKVVREGEPMIKEVSDGLTNLDQSMEYKFIDSFGVACVFNALYGMYSLA